MPDMYELILILTFLSYFLYSLYGYKPFYDPHVPFMSSPFKTHRYDFHRYFSFTGLPLSTYLVSITFGRDKYLGLFIYRLLSAINGILVYLIALLVFDSELTALISALLFYYCCWTPTSYYLYVQPEVYANFFTLVGLTIVGYSLNESLPLGIILGSIISSLSFWCKFSSIESLWILIYIYQKNHFHIEFFVSTSIIFIMVLSAIFITRRSIKTKNDNKSYCQGQHSSGIIRHFYRYVIYSLNRTNNSKNIIQFLRTFLSPIFNHFCTIFPILFLFLGFMIFSDIGLSIKKLFIYWIIVSVIPVIIRLQPNSIFYFMIHVPLSIGASHFLVSLSPFSLANIHIFIPLCSIAYFLVYKPCKVHIFHYRKNLSEIDEIIQYLINRVSTNDYIFQDAYLNELYYEVNCRVPENQFYWANLLSAQFTTPNFGADFIKFLIKCKPKYYISIGNWTKLDLSYIEKISGLSYELEYSTNISYIYRLKNFKKPSSLTRLEANKLISNEPDCRQKNCVAEFVRTYLKGKITPDDYIFQNSFFPEIYDILNVNKPPDPLLRVHDLSDKHNSLIDSLLDFFKKKKPKYYIGLAPSVINLSSLEKATGLRYQIADATRCNIYRLVAWDLPIPPSPPLETLLRFDVKRSQHDREQFLRFQSFRDKLARISDINDFGKAILTPISQATLLLADHLIARHNTEILGFLDRVTDPRARFHSYRSFRFQAFSKFDIDSLFVCSTNLFDYIMSIIRFRETHKKKVFLFYKT
jgi:hypothetical protein